MKRFLLPGLLAVASAQLVFGQTPEFYINDFVIQNIPPNPPPQIWALNFVNHSFFNVTIPADDINLQFFYYQTSDTVNYTNTGTMYGNPGFDFETFPSSFGPQKMAGNFVNQANGLGGGVINVTGISTNSFNFPGIGLTGNSKLIVSATNIVNSGNINMANSSLVKLTGRNIDLTGGRIRQATGIDFFAITNGVFIDTGPFFFNNFGILDGYWGVGVDTNTINPLAFNVFPPASAFGSFALINAELVTTRRFGAQEARFILDAPVQAYLNLQDTSLIDSNRLFQVVYLRNTNSTITPTVYFTPFTSPQSYLPQPWEIGIQWQWGPSNFVSMIDDFVVFTNLTLVVDGNIRDALTLQPFNYFFQPTPYPFANLAVVGTPTAGPLTIFNNIFVTNDYAGYQAVFSAPQQLPEDVFRGNVTNMGGRVEIKASSSLDLTDSRISTLAYLLLSATNHFKSSAGANISSPYMDIALRSTNGTLAITNLVVPSIGALEGKVNCYSARWKEVVNGITNNYHVLFVDTQLQPTTPVRIQTASLTAVNPTSPGNDSIVISDVLNVTSNLVLNTTTLTLTTNEPGSQTPVAQLNILNRDVLWSSAAPRLKFMTNWGYITSPNLMNFAGNMLSPYSDPNAATPYSTFVNHGGITNQGSFIVTELFQNDGFIQNYVNGNFTLRAQCASLVNGLISSPISGGDITLTSDTLSISNHALQSGGRLSLSASSCLSDGYALFNQFGHTSPTNGPLNGGVTNGNQWTAGGAFSLPIKPATGDLLGTTVLNFGAGPANVQNSLSVWMAQDRGASPSGFVNDAAVGKLILDGGTNGQFYFNFNVPGAGKALYVDSIEFRGSATNANISGDLTTIHFGSGVKIYYAQAIANGISIAEKLSGRNGGHFQWVSNYAGIFSATNIFYSTDNLYHTFNQALVESQNIDSDGDLTANGNDPTPIPPSWVFDNTVPYTPCSCSSFTPSSTGGLGGIGSLFGGSLGSASGDNVLEFPVAPTISAVGTNLFALAQGDFNGLFYETNGVVPGHAGYFSANINNKGRLSGSLKLGTASYPLAGNFNSVGKLSLANLTSMNSAVRLNVSMQLDLGAGGQITGQVGNIGHTWNAMLLADRAVARGNKNFTFVVPGFENGGTEAPEGHGFGNLSIIGNGLVQWSATLADGTVIQPQTSARKTISAQGLYPLYFAPYGGAGLLIGWLQFTNQTDTDFAGEVIWIKPVNPARKLFKGGFTNETGVVGSAYVQPPVTSTNDMLVLGGGNLPNLVTNVFTLNQSFQVPKSGANKFNLKISKPTGVFNGSVIAGGRTNTFNGVLLQKAGAGYGFFLGTNESGQVWFSPTP